MAELAIRVGVDVQPGQLVVVLAQVENAPLVREIARAAYRAGASYVGSRYTDQHLARALIELGPDASLSASTPWDVTMLKTLTAERGAYIQVSGDPEPDLLADLDGNRVGRARPHDFVVEWGRMVSERLVSWTIVPAPNAGWARQVFGKPDVDARWRKQSGWIEPTPSRSGAPVWTASTALRARSRSGASIPCATGVPGPTSSWASSPAAGGPPATSRPYSATGTYRTCPRRKSSHRQIAGVPTASCDRPDPSRSAARWCATSSSSFEKAGSSKSARPSAPM